MNAIATRSHAHTPQRPLHLARLRPLPLSREGAAAAVSATRAGVRAPLCAVFADDSASEDSAHGGDEPPPHAAASDVVGGAANLVEKELLDARTQQLDQCRDLGRRCAKVVMPVKRDELSSWCTLTRPPKRSICSGETVVASRAYTFVVRTSSWYTRAPVERACAEDEAARCRCTPPCCVERSCTSPAVFGRPPLPPPLPPLGASSPPRTPVTGRSGGAVITFGYAPAQSTALTSATSAGVVVARRRRVAHTAKLARA